MATYRRRGLALNYLYFKNNLAADISYIYTTIQPGDWVFQEDGSYYSYQIENKLPANDNIIHAATRQNDQREVYLPVLTDSRYITLQSSNRPAVAIDFLAFPESKVNHNTRTIYEVDFVYQNGYWTHTVDLAPEKEPILVEAMNNDVIVYYDMIIDGTVVTLNATNKPTFVTTLHSYSL